MFNIGKINHKFLMIGLGLVCLIGVGYFSPSLRLDTITPNHHENFIKQISKQHFSDAVVSTFPDYDYHLSEMAQRALSVYTNSENIHVIVRTDLSVSHEDTVRRDVFPETSVIRRQLTTTQENNVVIKDATYDYSTVTTKTQAYYYHIKKMNVLIFLTQHHQSSLVVDKSKIQEIIQTSIGYDINRGDLLRLIEIPHSISHMTFTNNRNIQIRQIFAIIFMCLLGILIVSGVLIPLCISLGRKQPVMCQKAFAQKDGYHHQIVGHMEENLILKAQDLCMRMPEAAVNILRNWLSWENRKNKENGSFSPAQKAAIVLLCLGDNCIRHLFKKMTDTEIFSLSRLMASLGQVKAIEIQPILLSFCHSMNEPQDIRETKPLIETVIRNTLPIDKAAVLLKELKIQTTQKTIWDKVNQVPTSHLSSFLLQEYPQTSAVILYHLTTEKAAAVLAEMDAKTGAQILLRLSSLQYMDKNNIHMIELNLEKQIDSLMKRVNGVGEKKASAILSLLDKKTQGRYISSLERLSPQTVGVLEKNILNFDDLAHWHSKDLIILLKHIDNQTLVLALSNARNATKEAFSRVISPQKWSKMLNQMRQMPIGKIEDIDMSQRAVIRIAQQLIESKKCKGTII